jgi:hypothetical protein
MPQWANEDTRHALADTDLRSNYSRVRGLSHSGLFCLRPARSPDRLSCRRRLIGVRDACRCFVPSGESVLLRGSQPPVF